MQSFTERVRPVSIRAEEGLEQPVEERMSGVAAAYEQDLVDRDR
jgi:hypothetical protein